MEDNTALQLSPLQLNKYFIKELHFAVKGDFDGKYDQTAEFPYPQLSARVSHTQSEQNPREWRLELTLESDDSQSEKFPYTLKIILVGYFTVIEEYPSERANMLAHVNGPSLLYSAAREALVTITGRSGFPAIVLPSVMFVQHALNVSKSAEKQTGTKKSRATQKRSTKVTEKADASSKPLRRRSKKGERTH
jgi:preprotein translocase subunit SecB